MTTTLAGKRIYIAGHRGLVGSALARRLEPEHSDRLVVRSRGQLDLTNEEQVDAFFQQQKPSLVFVAAAKVGGILANNQYPVDFLRDNLRIELNLIDAAYRHGVEKLLFLGSSCIYPKAAPQPMNEDSLLTGELEPTNEAYAIAKIAGIKLCQSYWRQHGCRFISVMPTNLYGPNDNFDLESSHVIPALIRKFHEGKMSQSDSVTIWGTGTPRREFLHVDDLADACVHLMKHWERPDPVNVGVGEDVSILELAEMVSDVVGFEGRIEHDRSKPDGTPRKLLDVSRLRETGWEARIQLRDGLVSTYEWFCEHGVGT